MLPVKDASPIFTPHQATIKTAAMEIRLCDVTEEKLEGSCQCVRMPHAIKGWGGYTFPTPPLAFDRLLQGQRVIPFVTPLKFSYLYLNKKSLGRGVPVPSTQS